MLGRIEMQLGLPREAARRFEAILARRPDLPRVRVELASAYFLAERDDKARYHFEAALAERLPASVETEIRRFLDRIDNRRRWSSSFALALVPESNPAHRTQRRTVHIGGVPWELGPDSRAKSGTGVLMSGGISFSPAIGGGLSGALAATGSGQLYRRREWNDVSVAGDLGLAWPSDRYAVSGGLRAGRRWLGHDGFSRSIGPWMRGSLRLSDRTRAALASDVARVVHDEHPDRDGWRWSARPGVFHALSSRSSMEAQIDLEAVSSRAQRRGSRMAGTLDDHLARLRGRHLDLTGSRSLAAAISRPRSPIRRDANRHDNADLRDRLAPSASIRRLRAPCRLQLRDHSIQHPHPCLPQSCCPDWRLPGILIRPATRSGDTTLRARGSSRAREAGGSRDEAGAALRAPNSSGRPHDVPRLDPPGEPSCGSPTRSTRTRGPAPRACGPCEPAPPSGAGTPARTAVVSSTSGHLLCAMVRCPPKADQLHRFHGTRRCTLPATPVCSRLCKKGLPMLDGTSRLARALEPSGRFDTVRARSHLEPVFTEAGA